MPISSAVLKRIEADDPSLTELDLSYQKLTAVNIGLLVKTLEKNTHLTKLNLYANQIGDEGVVHLVKNTRLVALNLAANQISKIGTEALASHKTITSLDLSYNQLKGEDINIIAQSKVLTRLILKDNLISTEGITALSRNTLLKYLDLTDNFIDETGAILLAQGKTCTSLILTGNPIGEVGAIALAENNTFTDLTLCHCRIGAKGAKALAQNTSLKSLNIGYNRIGSEGADAFAKNTTLKKLIATANQISNSGASSFAHNKTLVFLDISFNQISDSGVIELSKNPVIQHLNLSHNQIDFDGTLALANNSTLTHLDLSHNLLVGDAGAKELAESKSLTSLDLTGNQVSFEGAYALGKSESLKKLTLSNNLINDAGAIFLARSSRLVELFLSQNKIGVAGAMALAESATLKVLNLNYNPIGPKGRETLAENKGITNLSLTERPSPEVTGEMQAKAIFLLAQDYLCLIGYDGSIEFFNPAFCRVLGYSDDELLTQSILHLLHPGDRVAGEEQLARSRAKPLNYENRYLCKDGSHRFIRWTSEVRYDRIYMVGSDITEIMRSEKELEKAQQRTAELRLEQASHFTQQQTEFIAQLCHEVRNPLNAIYNLVDIVEENLQKLQEVIKTQRKVIEQALIPEIDESFKTINSGMKDMRTCVEHQKSILDDNVDLSKITEKKLLLKNEPLNLNKFISESAALFSTISSKKGLDLKVEVPQEEILVKADAARLRQVLINLINNAIKFTHTGSITTRLSIREDLESYVTTEITVTDTGIGISEQDMAGLFKRFSQAVGSQYGGSGLGLYISRTLTQLMGGTLAVASEKDKYTTFKCVIPFEKLSLQKIAAMEEAAKSTSLKSLPSRGTFFSSESKADTKTVEMAPPKPSEPLVSTAKRKILIVDDNQINRKILASQLKANYDCVLAEEGLQALDFYDHSHFDVILMDTLMPHMDGLTAVKEIRQREHSKGLRRTPILMVTANAMEQDRAKALAAGADGYLIKPFKKEEVYEKIKLLIENEARVDICPSSGPPNINLKKS